MDTAVHARIRPATPADAFAVAALTMQNDRESGSTPRSGFLDDFADAWLTDTAAGRRLTWLAEGATGRPLGMVHGAIVTRLPSSRRATDAWFHVSLLHVTADSRGHGLGERLLRTLLEDLTVRGVTRVQLNAVPAARSLYARVGFTPPVASLLEWRPVRHTI